MGKKNKGDQEYRYHLFVSYKYDELIMPWLEGFINRLEFYLRQEVGDLSIFFDKEAIRTGAKWKKKLYESIRTSMCMIAFWSPEYFRSAYCVTEWKSFLEREKLENINLGGLIIPVTINDGDSFPSEAKDTQQLKVHEYTSLVNAFWNSQKALLLEEEIRKLALEITESIHNSPAFKAGWPVKNSRPYKLRKVSLSRL